MKRIFLLISLLALSAAPAAGEKLVFQGTLTVGFGANLGGVSAMAVGTGLATVNASNGFDPHLNTLQIEPGLGPHLSATVTVPGVPPLPGGLFAVQFQSLSPRPRHAATSGDNPRFGPISGALQNTSLQLSTMSNTMPLWTGASGLIRFCLMAPCPGIGSLTLGLVSTQGIGVGGTTVTTTVIPPFTMPRFLDAIHRPWTIKTEVVSSVTTGGGTVAVSTTGFAHGPASLTSSTALTSGVVQIVTASQIETNIGFHDPENARLAALFASLQLHFVPEPSWMLLLGSGAGLLALLGRRRAKR